MTRAFLLLTVLAIMTLLGHPAAPAAETGSGEISRRVLGVLNSRGIASRKITDSAIHTLFEKPLNHYGFLGIYLANTPTIP